MNVAENLLLQQMQTMANLPKAGNTGNKDQTGSFQDMMSQAGKDSAVDSGKDPSAGQPNRTEKPDSPQQDPKAPVQKKDGEKIEETQVDPSAAVLVMDMFRPEIVEVQPEAAAAAADIFDYETGFQLVCKRGELMQREAEKFDTAMMAVVKLTSEQVQKICNKYPDVYAVNFNAPGQVSVSGLSSQMKDFSADVKKAGGRAIPLKVKGAFHSPFMEGAAHAFAKELAKVDMKGMSIKLYSDLTSEPYTEDAVGLLSKQVCNPVQWEKLVRNMAADGVDTFIEIGPGKTLTNMIKKIVPEATARSVMDYLPEVGSC